MNGQGHAENSCRLSQEVSRFLNHHEKLGGFRGSESDQAAGVEVSSSLKIPMRRGDTLPSPRSPQGVTDLRESRHRGRASGAECAGHSRRLRGQRGCRRGADRLGPGSVLSLLSLRSVPGRMSCGVLVYEMGS